MKPHIIFKEMTEELFGTFEENINTIELAQYMSHIKPDLKSVLHWSSIEYLEIFAGSFWLSEKEGNVYLGIFLIEAFRGKNIGDFCIEHVFNLANQEEVKQLYLNVRATNRRAILFYEKHGFQYVNTGMNHLGIEFICMRKNLAIL